MTEDKKHSPEPLVNRAALTSQREAALQTHTHSLLLSKLLQDHYR